MSLPFKEMEREGWVGLIVPDSSYLQIYLPCRFNSYLSLGSLNKPGHFPKSFSHAPYYPKGAFARQAQMVPGAAGVKLNIKMGDVADLVGVMVWMQPILAERIIFFWNNFIRVYKYKEKKMGTNLGKNTKRNKKGKCKETERKN